MPFLLIFLVGLIFTEASSRLHLPYVSALIVGGLIFGQSMLDLIPDSEAYEFLANLGLIFLFFLAGTKINFRSLADAQAHSLPLLLLNSLLPFIIGFSFSYIYAREFQQALMIGIIFVTSSVPAILPTLQAVGLENSRLGQALINTGITQEIIVLASLGVFSQMLLGGDGSTVLLTILLISLVIIFLHDQIVRLVSWFDSHQQTSETLESHLRFILMVLFAGIVLFEVVGLDGALGAFVVGVLLGDYVNKENIKQKIHTLGYGFFIPVFFILVGSQLELRLLSEGGQLMFLSALVLGSFASKIIGGYLGARLSGFMPDQSLALGLGSTPHLATSLAVIFAAREFQILEEDYLTSLVLLVIITATIGPELFNLSASRLSKHYSQTQQLKSAQVKPKAMH